MQKKKTNHLIYASTSSVYGESKKFPLKENYSCENPIQFYATTKLSNEIMAKSYSKVYNLKTTGLRFFTVYGPWEDLIWLYLNSLKILSKTKK